MSGRGIVRIFGALALFRVSLCYDTPNLDNCPKHML